MVRQIQGRLPGAEIMVGLKDSICPRWISPPLNSLRKPPRAQFSAASWDMWRSARYESELADRGDLQKQ